MCGNRDAIVILIPMLAWLIFSARLDGINGSLAEENSTTTVVQMTSFDSFANKHILDPSKLQLLDSR